MVSPYSGRPAHTFWKRAVAGKDVQELAQIIPVVPDLQTSRIATAGSCFAQHIGHNLRIRGLNYLDLEPMPPLLRQQDGAALGYGIYSCRYGNIYTSRQLLQLMQEAFGQRSPRDAIWQKNGRYFDALRPTVEPMGFESEAEVRVLREQHLGCVRRMFEQLDVFVFTMGLTETWASRDDGTVYPVAPGVSAGTYRAEDYAFLNLTFGDVMADMIAVREMLHAVNPTAQIMLTVSPVGLAATATPEHVLTATTYSKAVLRAVAGELTQTCENVQYFPSYEIIVGPPAGHAFYAPDLREVTMEGVGEVMRQFFAVNQISSVPETGVEEDDAGFGYEQCDDDLLSAEAPE